ncbi:unnamed protein product [Musa hybrid cultivar]
MTLSVQRNLPKKHGASIRMQAEKAAFDEAENNKEEEDANNDDWDIDASYSLIFL